MKKANSEAYLINRDVPAVLAAAAEQSQALLIHYSTDYVFDGRKDSPYTETDPTQALNIYGDSKLQGEQAIQASKARHLILRTSWVYSLPGHNFPNTILKAAQQRSSLSVIGDQFGSPTPAWLIADVTSLILHNIITHRGNCLA